MHIGWDDFDMASLPKADSDTIFDDGRKRKMLSDIVRLVSQRGRVREFHVLRHSITAGVYH